jgi:hypothetical protein
MQTPVAVSAPKPEPLRTADAMDSQVRAFEEDGYLLIPNLIDRQRLAGLTSNLVQAYRRVGDAGLPFVGGGRTSGHLNCFPGAESRFVYDTLEQRGVFELVRRLSRAPLRKPNIGCNFNLPGSHEQNDHVDGDPARPFYVVNVAAVDTTLENGAMEILSGTHSSTHEYWRLLLAGYPRRRVPMNQGDVLVRISTLWHRGMPNRTQTPRPMLAFTWEDGGSTKDDPYDVHGGAITFLPNRYGSDWVSRLRERAFAVSPRAGTAFLALRSLVASPPRWPGRELR